MCCRKYGEAGLPDKTINIQMKGTGGQSFCAFLAHGVYVELEGDANDYVAKVTTSCLEGIKNSRQHYSLIACFLFQCFPFYFPETFVNFRNC